MRTPRTSAALRQGVAEGQNEPAIDEAIFVGRRGRGRRPDRDREPGFYVIQVEKVNPAETQPLDEATSDADPLAARHAGAAAAVTEFQDEFVAKWRARTVCSEDLMANDD